MLPETERERLDPADDEPGIEGGGNGAVGVLEEAETHDEVRVRGDDRSAEDVRVPVDVLLAKG